MKKCPTCQKTFDDAMKFCQTDGTPLVEAAENAPNDPFKTMVAGKDELASAVPPDPLKTMVGIPPIKSEDEELEIPEDADFMKTMVSSPESFNVNKNTGETDKPITNPPSESDSFGRISKPEDSITSDRTSIMDTDFNFDSSPLELDSKPLPNEPSSSRSPFGNPSKPPIPSPFDRPPSSGFQSPPVPEFKIEEIKSEALNTPYAEEVEQQNPPYRQSEWTPPPAPVASWQNQDIGQNTPFQPPSVVQGENKTLAIVSLVCGILSLLCCTSLLPGIAAIITGFIAKKNANEKPNEYGGSGMALAGIILGGVSIVFGLIILVLYIFTGVLAGIGNIQ